VEHALGLAGGAGGVEDEQRIFRVHRFRFACRVGAGSGLVIPDIAPVLHHDVAAGTAHDQHAGHAGAVGERLVDIGLQRYFLAAAQPFVRGDDEARVAILDAAGKAVRREAAEHHRVDRADPGAGEHGKGCLGNHRQVDRHPITLAHAIGLEGVGEAAHLLVQLAIADATLLARRITFPQDCHGVALRHDMTVYAVRGDIERAILEPFDAEIRLVEAGVLHLGKRSHPVQPLRLLAPESFGIAQGLRIHRVIAFGVDLRAGGPLRRNRMNATHGISLLYVSSLNTDILRIASNPFIPD
jgi:hypothetical protein